MRCALVLAFVLYFNECEASDPNKLNPTRKFSKEDEEKTEFVYTPSPVANWSPIHHSRPLQNHAEFIRGIRPVAPPSAIHLSSAELSHLVNSVKIPHELSSQGASSSRSFKKYELDKVDQRYLPEAPIIPQANDGNSKKIIHRRAGSLNQKEAKELTVKMEDAKSEVHRLPFRGQVEVPQQGHLQDSPKVEYEQHLAQSVNLNSHDNFNHALPNSTYHPVHSDYHDKFSQQSQLPENALQDYIPEGIPSNRSHYNNHNWDHSEGPGSGTQ